MFFDQNGLAYCSWSCRRSCLKTLAYIDGHIISVIIPPWPCKKEQLQVANVEPGHNYPVLWTSCIVIFYLKIHCENDFFIAFALEGKMLKVGLCRLWGVRQLKLNFGEDWCSRLRVEKGWMRFLECTSKFETYTVFPEKGTARPQSQFL